MTGQLLDTGIASVTKVDAADATDRHTNLRGNVRLYDDIAEVERPPTTASMSVSISSRTSIIIYLQRVVIRTPSDSEQAGASLVLMPEKSRTPLFFLLCRVLQLGRIAVLAKKALYQHSHAGRAPPPDASSPPSRSS
jgi:hypothetical protein